MENSFSLIDQVEEIFLNLTKGIDNEYFQRRIDQGRLLRIGLADRRLLLWKQRSPQELRKHNNLHAYVYVDQYRDVEDLVAALILSSYIPGITGPSAGSLSPINGAVRRSHARLQEMIQHGFVKSIHGQPVPLQSNQDSMTTTRAKNVSRLLKDRNKSGHSQEREFYWDGGLANTFPIIDSQTCVVTPFCGDFTPNPSICPDTRSIARAPTVALNQRVQLHLCVENVETLMRVGFSSEDVILQDRFSHGYDDAYRFLSRQNLLSEFSFPSVQVMNTEGNTSPADTSAARIASAA